MGYKISSGEEESEVVKRVVTVVVVDVEGAAEAPAMTLMDPAWPKSESKLSMAD